MLMGGAHRSVEVRSHQWRRRHMDGGRGGETARCTIGCRTRHTGRRLPLAAHITRTKPGMAPLLGFAVAQFHGEPDGDLDELEHLRPVDEVHVVRGLVDAVDDEPGGRRRLNRGPNPRSVLAHGRGARCDARAVTADWSEARTGAPSRSQRGPTTRDRCRGPGARQPLEVGRMPGQKTLRRLCARAPRFWRPVTHEQA